MNPASPPGVKWGKTFTATATLTDTDNGNTGISGQTLTFGGSGTSATATSAVTDVTGTPTLLTTVTASGAGTVGTQNIHASFAGDVNYVSSSSNTPITILKHVTATILNSITSPFVNNPFSINGELDDVDMSNAGMPGKTITFAKSADIVSVPGTNTNGITFADSSNLVVNSCSLCSGAINVMRLHGDPSTGALITLPSKPSYVTLFLADMSGGSVTIQVTYGDGSISDPTDPQFTHAPVAAGSVTPWGLTSADNVGISQIQIYGVSGGTGLAGISEVQTFDSILGLVLDLTFSPTPSTNQISFNQGEYFTIGRAGSSGHTGSSVQASFDGTLDPDYLSSSSTTQTFNTYLSASAGVGGLEPSVPDIAQAITVKTCTDPGTPAGDSLDVDNLCKSWKSSGTGHGSGIPYTYKPSGTGTPTHAYYPLRNSVVGNYDVYYEIDSKSGYAPLTAALNDVNNTFSTKTINGHAVHMYYTLDETGLTVDSPINVWSDGDATFTNDFDSIKAYHFGKSTEYSVLTTQSQTITAGIDTLHKNLDVTGVSITTPTDSRT